LNSGSFQRVDRRSRESGSVNAHSENWRRRQGLSQSSRGRQGAQLQPEAVAHLVPKLKPQSWTKTSQTKPIARHRAQDGSVRSDEYRERHFGQGARLLPPRLVQEHSRDGASDQRLEGCKGLAVSGKCDGEEGGCPNEAIRRQHWSYCSG
jgi:hypothetical protein